MSLIVAKAPTEHALRSWAVYHIAAKLKLVGFVDDQPDEASAISKAIEMFEIPVSLQGRLIAQRRD